jgi:hypothetical protein
MKRRNVHLQIYNVGDKMRSLIYNIPIATAVWNSSLESIVWEVDENVAYGVCEEVKTGISL